MSKTIMAGGTVHKMPADLRQALASAPKALNAWRTLTPLARNEWICWTVTVKQQKTRDGHIKRVVSELEQGLRRPCCWMGCIHRADKPVSPSVRWVLNKQRREFGDNAAP